LLGAILLLKLFQGTLFLLKERANTLKSYIFVFVAISFMVALIIITGKFTLNNSINLYSLVSSPVGIKSEIGAEEKILKLKQHLEYEDWMSADAETTNLLHRITQNSNNSRDHFSVNNFQELPCEDLQTIDQLWVHYSSKKFGYSIQESILREVGDDLFQFGTKVGWLKDDIWVFQNDYDLKAPKGHLPSPLNVSVVLQRTTPEQSSNPQLRRTLPEQPPTQLQRTLPQQPSNTLTRTEPSAPSVKPHSTPLIGRTLPSKVPLAWFISITRSCENYQ